jgi:hypothetical protein
VGIRLHRTTKCLLTNERKSISIIDDDKSERVFLSMTPFTEVIDLVTNCMNTPVLFGTEIHHGFDVKGCLCFEHGDAFLEESRFPATWWSCNKEMGEIRVGITNCLEKSVLSKQGIGHLVKKGLLYLGRVYYEPLYKGRVRIRGRGDYEGAIPRSCTQKSLIHKCLVREEDVGARCAGGCDRYGTRSKGCGADIGGR